jgi:hypothetical protein
MLIAMLRLPQVNETDLARSTAEYAVDFFQVTSRKKSAPAACRHWMEHFTVLKCRASLEKPFKDEITDNLLDLQNVLDHSSSAFVRFQARVEIAGQYVRLRTPDVAEKLKDLSELDDSYDKEWVVAAGRLRPIIEHGIGHAESVRDKIKTYGRIVLPKKSLRHTALFAKWMAAIGEPIKVNTRELRFWPFVPPIEPWTTAQLTRQ